MFTSGQMRQAAMLLAHCRRRKFKIATAESCTGGLVSALLTEIPGSSDVFDRGFVTYSNTAKIKQLGVSAATIKKYGAVSKEVAIAMAQGALTHSDADIAISVTGIAGPGGGTKEKPVGLVYIAVATRRRTSAKKCHFKGTRGEIRLSAVSAALNVIARIAKQF
jgi:nicotinamide-nucleotide amidase